jgi:hypothetical protein
LDLFHIKGGQKIGKGADPLSLFLEAHIFVPERQLVLPPLAHTAIVRPFGPITICESEHPVF